MDTRKEWTFVLTLVAICLGKKNHNRKCTNTNGSNCPNITCSKNGEVCYKHQGQNWHASVTFNNRTTDYNCVKDDYSWKNLPVNCSNSSSTDSATTTTTAITTTTTTTTATTSLTTSSGNNTETGSVNQDGNIGLYVGVACVIVVLVILVVLLVVWRRKKSHNKETHHNGIAVHNQSYRRHDWTNSNDTPIQISDLSSRGDDNEYSEIPADTITSFNENESTYNTIDLPNGVHDNYSHVASKTAAGNDTTYSHMPENVASKITNNTYAHIGIDSSMPQVELKPADDADDTYNKLQTLPNNGIQNRLRKPDVEKIDQDTEYNHLAADLKRPIEVEEEELGDTYSHLCQSGKRNLEHPKQGKTTQSLMQQRMLF